MTYTFPILVLLIACSPLYGRKARPERERVEAITHLPLYFAAASNEAVARHYAHIGDPRRVSERDVRNLRIRSAWRALRYARVLGRHQTISIVIGPDQQGGTAISHHVVALSPLNIRDVQVRSQELLRELGRQAESVL